MVLYYFEIIRQKTEHFERFLQFFVREKKNGTLGMISISIFWEKLLTTRYQQLIM